MNSLAAGLGETLIRRIRNEKPEPPRPWSTVERRRDAKCVECGRVYLKTNRTYCPTCDAFTVTDALTK